MHNERAQMTVVTAGVIALILAGVVVATLVGEAMIDRTTTSIAADATALAGAIDPQAGAAVADWYQRRGIGVQLSGGVGGAEARANGQPASAISRAQAETVLRGAPLIQAIVARAGQLLGHEFEAVDVHGLTVRFGPGDAERFAPLAASFGMCRSEPTTFARC